LDNWEEPVTELTEKQAEIHAYLCERWQNPPSMRELAAHYGVNLNSINGHLKALARKGFITMPDGKQARGIKLLRGPDLDGSAIEIAGQTYRLVKENADARSVTEAG
jgi:SOS-response transcriptional repressor LexA